MFNVLRDIAIICPALAAVNVRLNWASTCAELVVERAFRQAEHVDQLLDAEQV